MNEDQESTAGRSPSGDEVVAWAENGRLIVAGDPTAVDAFLAELRPDRELDLERYAGLALGVGALVADPGTRRVAKRFVELGPSRWRELMQGGYRVELYGKIRDTSNGQFVGGKMLAHSRIPSIDPVVLIGMAAIHMAISSLSEEVEAIARDVGELRRIADATEVGNLAGLYRVLANARAQVDRTGTMSRTTWESIATGEVAAQQSADRIRAYIREELADLPLDEDARRRLEKARGLLSDGTIQRSLKLLLLAEQCRLLWRSLKLDQVRTSEPHALEDEAESAKVLLAENAAADRDLVEALRASSDRLTRVGPFDGVRFGTRSRLPAAGALLRAQIDEFAAARAQQLDSWRPRRVRAFGTPRARSARPRAELPSRGVGSWAAGSRPLVPGSRVHPSRRPATGARPGHRPRPALRSRRGRPTSTRPDRHLRVSPLSVRTRGPLEATHDFCADGYRVLAQRGGGRPFGGPRSFPVVGDRG